MWCQITPPDPFSGQTTIILWPLYSLYNALPSPLHWRLLHPLSTEPSLAPGAQEGHRRGESGVLQPGEEHPLAVALEGGQALSLQLPQGSIATMHNQEVSPQSTGTTPTGPTWSAPLEARRHAGSTEAARMFPEAHRSKAMLPEAGQQLAWSIPCQGTGQTSLSAVLAARPGSNQAPSTALCVVPHAVMHNSLPVAVTLACPGLPHQATAAPSSRQALDWGQGGHQPKKAVLAVLAQHGQTLQSDAFALDSEHDIQLSFTASHQAELAQPHQQGPAQTDHLVFCAAVSVHSSKLDFQAGAPAATGTAAAAGRSMGMPVEVIHISITPACLVTNLTSHHLRLQLEGPTALVASQPGRASQPDGQASRGVSNGMTHQSGASSSHSQADSALQVNQGSTWPLCCAASQTVPVLNAWRSAQPQLSGRQVDPKQAAALPRIALRVSLMRQSAVSAQQNDSSEGNADPPTPSSAPQTPVTPPGQRNPTSIEIVNLPHQHQAAHATSQSHDAVLLTQPCGRRHLHVASQDQQEWSPVVLAYRTLLSRGRLHLVFFVDPQPPVVLHNATSEMLSIAWADMGQHEAQHAQHAEQKVDLPAGACLDCNPYLDQTGQLNSLSCQAG